MQRTLLAFTIAGVLLAGGPTLAQEADAATATKPVDAAAAKKALLRARDAYSKLKTYQDVCSERYEMVFDGDSPFGEPPTNEKTLKVSRPGSFAIESNQMTVVCDGKTLWCGMPDWAQYTEQPSEGLAALDDLPYFDTTLHPIANVLLRADARSELLFPMLASVSEAKPEVRAGEAGMRIFGKGEWPGYGPGGGPSTITVWISDRTGLVGEITTDLTKAYKGLMKEMAERGVDEDEFHSSPKPEQIKKFVISLSFDKIEVDAPIAAEAFAFKPSPEMKKVDQFNPEATGTQLSLLGSAAADASGKDLDGKAVSVADLKGRVVVLDFWATWCRPCVQALPHMQELAEKFKDKPVTVLAVNQDRGDVKRVGAFLEKKKITIRQLMDEDGSIGRRYMVRGIPSLVIIDAKGIVQEVKTGFGPGEEDDLADKIDKLLEGKPLRTEQELAALKAQEDSIGGDGDWKQAPTTEGVSITSALEETTPERLVAGTTLRSVGFYNAQMCRLIDIDGDGKQELVSPGMQNSLTVLSSDGSAVRNIKLGGRSANASIMQLEAVRSNGELRWLVSFQKYNGQGTGQSSYAGLYAEDGRELWRYSPQVPEKSSCSLSISAADLDGSGQVRVAVGLNVYSQKKISNNSYQQVPGGGYLIILSPDGKVESQKRVGRSLTMIHACAAPQDGGKPVIVCFTEMQAQRYTFDAGAITSEEHRAK